MNDGFYIQIFLVSNFLQVISQIQSIEGLNGNNFESNIQEYSVSRLEFLGLSVSFTLPVNKIPDDVIDIVSKATLDALSPTSNLTIDEIGVLAFQPNCKEISLKVLHLFVPIKCYLLYYVFHKNKYKSY